MYMKYENSITYHSKVIANVKVFYKQTDILYVKLGQTLYAPNLLMSGKKIL